MDDPDFSSLSSRRRRAPRINLQRSWIIRSTSEKLSVLAGRYPYVYTSHIYNNGTTTMAEGSAARHRAEAQRGDESI